MELPTNVDTQPSSIPSNDVEHQSSAVPPDVPNHGPIEHENEIGEEEARNILEVMASTGKFWHDWDKLKRLLSIKLKQVLSEYPEAKMTIEQQNSSLGETYEELVERLNEALCSFMEGPPFTLQRLCEITLTAKSIYPKLPKLALALEKNLLVTSTLNMSTDPYPPATKQAPEEIDKIEDPQSLSDSAVQNGGNEHAEEEETTTKDEVMADAEAAAADADDDVDDMKIDVGASEETTKSQSPPEEPDSTSSVPATESSQSLHHGEVV